MDTTETHAASGRTPDHLCFINALQPERVRGLWKREEAHTEERSLEDGDGSCPGESQVSKLERESSEEKRWLLAGRKDLQQRIRLTLSTASKTDSLIKAQSPRGSPSTFFKVKSAGDV